MRRSVLINAPPERVWQEFESLEKMRLWFGTGHTLVKYEPRVGGEAELFVVLEGRELHFGGQIVVFDPAHELTFENQWIPNDEKWDAPSLLTIRLMSALDAIVELFPPQSRTYRRDGGGEPAWLRRRLDDEAT